MGAVTLTFLGAGDAFGSGGRLQTCMLLRGGEDDLAVDCGSSSLVALKRVAVDPAEVAFVLVSHLHGDHFGGIPFLVLDGQFSQRTRPLVVAGPPGSHCPSARSDGGAVSRVRECVSSVLRRVRGAHRSRLEHGRAGHRDAVRRRPRLRRAAVRASNRLRSQDDVYSGDTAWTDTLVEAVKGADLFVCESYFFDKKVRYHLDYTTLKAHRHRLECARVMLTHMSEDMLHRSDDVEFECAEDGRVVVV